MSKSDDFQSFKVYTFGPTFRAENSSLLLRCSSHTTAMRTGIQVREVKKCTLEALLGIWPSSGCHALTFSPAKSKRHLLAEPEDRARDCFRQLGGRHGLRGSFHPGRLATPLDTSFAPSIHKVLCVQCPGVLQVRCRLFQSAGRVSAGQRYVLRLISCLLQ